MKSISKIIAIIGLILFSGIQANAQNAEIQEHNYVVLTKKYHSSNPFFSQQKIFGKKTAIILASSK